MSHIDESLLQAYIDGFCDAPESAGIERHVEECESCRVRLDEARAAMSWASELLDSLEPGPIHAPAFEELVARAAENQGETAGATPVSDSVDAPRDPTPNIAPVVSPFWRRPSLAWAATLVLAFGLGWLSRSELGLPVGLESGLFDQPEKALGTYRPESAERETAAAEAFAEPEEAPADTEVAEGEIDDRVMAERQVAAPVPSAPAISADADRKTRDEQLAQAPPPAAGPPVEGRANQTAVAGAAGRVAEPEPEAQVQFQLNEEVGEAAFADAERAGGYFSVSIDEAEDWLGVAPRRLPELTLVRAEVGPATMIPEGVSGLPTVRLVYQDQSGQEIALVQQYLGALEGKEEAKLTTAADRIAPGRAGERPEQGGAESRLRADAELDYFAVGGLANLPVLEVTPDGRTTQRWIDADGYLLTLSGSVPADILLGLADRIR